MLQSADTLWNLVQNEAEIDPSDLARAIESASAESDMDYRTRMLIRESAEALRARWGDQRFSQWLKAVPRVAALCEPDDPADTKIGFPSLARRVVDTTKPDAVERFIRDLSERISQPADLYIGGSIALILARVLSRRTEDIDLVDEIPASIRSQPDVLNELSHIHHIALAHFQSHYLPEGWRNRVKSYGVFGSLRVYVVDEIDVFVGKLFSNRVKDRRDLRVIADKLDRNALGRRVKETTHSLQRDPELREAGERNWYVLFGEPLPTTGSGT